MLDDFCYDECHHSHNVCRRRSGDRFNTMFGYSEKKYASGRDRVLQSSVAAPNEKERTDRKERID